MPRYFFNIAYKGTFYKGLQKQNNAISIEGTLINALNIYYKKNVFISLTFASRTDAGVHAYQNTCHVDFTNALFDTQKDAYHLNAILPNDVVIKKIYAVKDIAHARFDAIKRYYKYTLYNSKNPFLQDFAMCYHYKIDYELINKAARIVLFANDFTSFCKKHSQNHTYLCNIFLSEWNFSPSKFEYTICANRFLRGMVRALVGTMLLVGRKKITLQHFENFFINPKLASADFSAEASGLCLTEIEYSNDTAL